MFRHAQTPYRQPRSLVSILCYAPSLCALTSRPTAACLDFDVQEEDQMEPEPHYEDFRTLRRKIFDWDGMMPAVCRITDLPSIA